MFFYSLYMKTRFLTLLFGTVVVLVFISSSGAPIGSTGAHGELTCGKSGCHVGLNGTANINTGIGELKINSAQNISNYIPGETYEITVSLKEEGVKRFGFSLTVLDSSNQKAGEIIITDSSRTQLYKGAREFSNREYATYRMAGTNPYDAGIGLWTFKWKAPEQHIGKITFYTAGISANNDGTDKGDRVYTQTLISQ